MGAILLPTDCCCKRGCCERLDGEQQYRLTFSSVTFTQGCQGTGAVNPTVEWEDEPDIDINTSWVVTNNGFWSNPCEFRQYETTESSGIWEAFRPGFPPCTQSFTQPNRRYWIDSVRLRLFFDRFDIEKVTVYASYHNNSRDIEAYVFRAFLTTEPSECEGPFEIDNQTNCGDELSAFTPSWREAGCNGKVTIVQI